MTTATTDQINALNCVAQSYQETHFDSDAGYGSPEAALNFAVRFAQLEEMDRQGDCRLYKFPAGELVNCWFVGANTAPIGSDGGPGFDDQVESYLDI